MCWHCSQAMRINLHSPEHNVSLAQNLAGGGGGLDASNQHAALPRLHTQGGGQVPQLQQLVAPTCNAACTNTNGDDWTSRPAGTVGTAPSARLQPSACRSTLHLLPSNPA